MKLFRTLLWWLLLAAFGALAWQLLSPDLGELIVRWHGRTVTTTVAFALLAWGLLWFALWALWTLLSFPFTAWQRLAQTQSRNRLVNGLLALHEGRHVRAESLLDKAAQDTQTAVVARLAARESALRRGDVVAAATQQAALARHDPLAAALGNAESLLAQQRPTHALEVLQPWAEKKALPPRGLQLFGDALAGDGKAAQALSLLGPLGAENNLAAENLATVERRWQAAALRQCPDTSQLHQQWNVLPERLRAESEILVAYAARAGELGLEADAANTLAQAVETRWDDALVRQYALLPPAREDQRLPRAQRWLTDHPANPTLAVALARLCRGARLPGKAEELLHRALALGAGAEAWEELGHVYTDNDDASHAQASYANALRQLRGEPARALGGRSLRELIADEAVAEQRDEHGLPRLR